MSWELIVGLETHIELSTNTKIFCQCTTEFGGKPNTHCCPVCIGLPGTLPKLNMNVVKYAVKAGLATNCNIKNISKMDRKNYVYPDLPKAYQITQYDKPLCEGGYITLSSGKKINITRIHIEEDAGKLVHEKGNIFIDYNRAGVPLIEIVSEPDIRSIDEALEYIENLRLVMKYIGVSDVKMQEGSLRCDVNISVRRAGEKEFGTRTEIKNMNSLNFISKAIDYEFKRQISILEDGGDINQETRKYNSDLKITESMRRKEEADDYRYFRDPDLVTITISDDEIVRIKHELPELPHIKLQRFIKDYNLSYADVELLIKYKKISEYFEEACKNVGNNKMVANFMLGQIFRYLSTEEEKENCNIPIPPYYLNELVKLIEKKKITFNMAKNTLEKMLETGKSVKDIISEKDMVIIDEGTLKILCEKALLENNEAVKSYLNGKEKALKSIIGYIMKETRGKADAKLAGRIIKELLASEN